MRAISLWQPWATAAALGAKRIETRHWATNYRGPLLIHAAKRCNKSDLKAYGIEPAWRAALNLPPRTREDLPLWDVLPLGQVVAVCNLVDCRSSESFGAELNTPRRREDDGPAWNEFMMGNFEPERFGWVLDDIHAFAQPVPFKGGQSFFNVPHALVAEQLASWVHAWRLNDLGGLAA